MARGRHPFRRRAAVAAGLSLGLLAGALGPAAVASAGAGQTPPAATPAGDQAPAATAIPAPGSATSSPRTAVTLTGVPAASIGRISVVGSRTGAHAGTTEALPDGTGATFRPTAPFAAGEVVTVTSSATVAGATASTYTFTVGTPAPHPGPQLDGDGAPAPAGPRAGTRATPAPTFTTRPDLRPPGVTIDTPAGATAPGLLFATPNANAAAKVDQGVLIYDEQGQPVWFRPSTADIVGDAFVADHLGQPALHYYEGTAPYGAGNYRGEWIVLDRSYRELARIRMGNGYQADIHELHVTDHGTAYLMAYNPLTCTGIAPLAGCKPGATVLEGVLQEVDLATGTVLWEWHSLDHVPLSRSLVPADQPLFDYIHINGIDEDTDGDVLLSGRTTSALYKIDRATGQLIWTFGGNDTDFTNLVGEPNAIAGPDFPHHIQALGGSAYSYFDNGSRRMGPSRGAIVALDPGTGTATYTTKLIRNPPLFANTQGSMQPLPGGHHLIAWGGLGVLTEYDASGTPVFDASLTSSGTYRQFRHEWVGAPAEPPVLAASPAGGGTSVHVSWNGDTRTASWRILTGASPEQLAAVATVARTGFETATVVPAGTAWVAAEALDGSGDVLGRTAPVQGSQWFRESAAPSVGQTYAPVVGDFAGTRNDDVLYYRPGAGADYLHVSDGAGGFTSIGLPAIGGSYTPLVGDFVGDDRDEVLWTTPGSTNAYLWRFDRNPRSGTVLTASATVKAPATVTKALVLDHRPNFGGGYDEVLWYAAGTAADRIDRYRWPVPGTFATASRAVTISGNYAPVTGDLDGNGLADVYFYGPGAQRDSIWFTTGTAAGSTGQRSVVVDVTGAYVPFVANFTGDERRDEILFAADGAAIDHLWTFDATGAHGSRQVTTSATGAGYVLQGTNDRLMTWTPGSSPSIWLLAPGPSVDRPSGNAAVPAGYRPLVGDFTGAGGTSSVLWYAPGSAAERLYAAG